MSRLARSLIDDDRGAGLVEYSLLTLLIAIGSMVVVVNVGESASETFVETADAFGTEDDLSPKDRWEQAKEEYAEAIAEAKAERDAALEKAKETYQARREANKDLPKGQRNEANKEAKAEYNAARSDATDHYKAAVQDAKDAKAAAKAEYNASK